MRKTKRNWHPKFITYMNNICSHPNYEGLPIEKKDSGELKWITPAKSKIGKKRLEWARNKAKSLGFKIEPGVYAKVMREIHPTKVKPCQICGREMSIYYFYPSFNLLKAIEKTYDLKFDKCTHIYNIWDEISKKVGIDKVKEFFIKIFSLSPEFIIESKETILNKCEQLCREEGKKLLSPGAMSNFPDRFDGFHTYNICCRSSQDTGRSKANLKSYTQDRRAYEYWSDGDIHAANEFMGSSYFNNASADHIGPISLGFVHDYHYLVKITTAENSSKRDRLTFKDIENVLEKYKSCRVYPMSWYGKEIWEYILKNYKNNPSLIETKYRNMLKQNMYNFMFCLGYILDNTGELGKNFLKNNYLLPKKKYFDYSYKFDENGNLVSKTKRHFTDRNINQFERFERIAFNSVKEYLNKENRHLHFSGSKSIIGLLNDLKSAILTQQTNSFIVELFEKTIFLLQKEILE